MWSALRQGNPAVVTTSITSASPACPRCVLSQRCYDRGCVVLTPPPLPPCLCSPHALPACPSILAVAVQEELKGKDITLLAEGGLKTKEDIGELFGIESYCGGMSRAQIWAVRKCQITRRFVGSCRGALLLRHDFGLLFELYHKCATTWIYVYEMSIFVVTRVCIRGVCLQVCYGKTQGCHRVLANAAPSQLIDLTPALGAGSAAPA